MGEDLNLHQQQLRVLEGMEYLAVLSRDRLNAALEALAEGDFDAAFDRASEARDKLQPLMVTQNGVAAFASGKRIVRAEDLQPGMVVVHRGTVAEVEEVEHPGSTGMCLHVKLEEEDRQDLHLLAGAELLVSVEL